MVESIIWRDRNLKFGPNYELEVDNLEKKIKIRRGDNRANATGHPANVPPLICSRDKQTFELNVCDDTDPSSPVLYGDEEELIQCSQACADAGRCLCSKCWSGKSYSS